MQSSLKKSLYLGLAALSFAGVAAVSTTASAKSYATAGAYSTLKTDATKRNVEATGTNALYTKPGTVKGAKVVASKATMATLASSKKSANYFRAYGVKTTNRGSVYYRVVTMDGKYRGYVYGGKSDTAFAGGIKSAETTTTATTPTKTTGYYLKDTSKNTLWTAPKYTQYKASKVSLYGAKADDTFTVSKAATKTREGSLYYYVTDDNNSSIAGWIYAGKGYDATITDNTKQDLGGLSLSASDAAATEDNSVTVNYLGKNGNSVGTKKFVTNVNGTKAGDDATPATIVNNSKQDLATFASKNVPSGYALDTTSLGNYTLNTDKTALATVTKASFGGTLNVNVYKASTSKLTLWAASTDGLSAGTQVTASDIYGGLPSITTDQAKALTNDASLNFLDTVTDLDNYFADGFDSADKTATAAMTVNKDNTEAAAGTTAATAIVKGDTYHVHYTYNATATKKANATAKFGDTIKVVFTTANVSGNATSTQKTSDTTTNY